MNKTKRHYILIVEDNALLYDRLAEKLTEENFEVSDFTPSVEDAIESIEKRRPDIALLDIMLEGDKTGLDLAKIINENYNFPFIYVTSMDNDYYFHKALQTHHQNFIPKKNSYDFFKNLLRAIYTALELNKEKNAEKKTHEPQAIGLEGLVDYLTNIKNMPANQVSKVPVKFEDITYFSLNSFVNDKGKKEELPPNYVWFLTKDNKRYFLPASLSDLSQSLPRNFIRVDRKTIVNLNYIEGRINGVKIKIKDKVFSISSTFKENFFQRYAEIYLSKK